jgi:hypothetical protein
MVGNRSFYPDYDLQAAGPHLVPEGSELLLMKVDECNEWKTRGWLVLRQKEAGKGTYERTGVLKMQMEDPETVAIDDCLSQ